MASAPQQLPLFYNSLEPLSSQAHAHYRMRTVDKAPFLVGQHAVPLTTEEFTFAQRTMPIIFTSGADPIPLALIGLNEGVNVYIDDEGGLIEPTTYVPAYVRRYPFMLARLTPDAEELSLCFDPTAGTVGDFEDGQPLFVDGEPSDATRNVLSYNEMFEQAGFRTAAFMKEVVELGLLMDGEISIQPEGADQPFIYRGFQMVDEQKLNDLRGDQLRKMVKSGMLPLLYMHLMSLTLMQDIFQRQINRGFLPTAEPLV